MPKGAKMIAYLRTENLKNHTLSRGTYLYIYGSTPPPPGVSPARFLALPLLNGLRGPWCYDKFLSCVAGEYSYCCLRKEWRYFKFVSLTVNLINSFIISHYCNKQGHVTEQYWIKNKSNQKSMDFWSNIIDHSPKLLLSGDGSPLLASV